MASIEKRVDRGTYRVSWTQDGVRHRKDFPTRKEAKAFAESLSEHRKRLPAGDAPKPKQETFSGAVDAFLRACEIGRDGNAALEGLTVNEYRRRLERHVVPLVGASTPVAAIDRAKMLEIREGLLRTGLVRGSSKKHLHLTKAVLQYAIARGVIAIDPTLRMTIKADKRAEQAKREAVAIHTKDEMTKIIAAAPQLGPRYHVMVNLLVFAGLRMSELRGLPVSAFDQGSGTIRITQRADMEGNIGSPKSVYAFRTIRLPERVASLVGTWVEKRNGHDLMFGTTGGRPIEHSNLSDRMWKRVQQKAGVRILNPHAARHFFASFLLDQGVRLDVLREALGHHDPMFTMRIYGHLFKDAGDMAERDRMASAMNTALTDDED